MEYIFVYISFLISFLAPSKMMIASVSLFGTTVHDGRKTESGPTSNEYCQNGKSCSAESGDKKEFKKASQNVPNLLEKSNIQSHIERLEVNGETKEE